MIWIDMAASGEARPLGSAPGRFAVPAGSAGPGRALTELPAGSDPPDPAAGLVVCWSLVLGGEAPPGAEGTSSRPTKATIRGIER